MLRGLTVVVAGLATIATVVVVLLFAPEIVGPFYEAMGASAGTGIGTTANDAVPMGEAFIFLGAAVIVVPVCIFLYFTTGNRTSRAPRGR